MLLAHPDLAQPVRAGVLVAGLEMQRGAVVHHQRRQAARGGGERRAGLRDPVTVVVVPATFQRPEQRPQRRRRRAEIGQHAQTVRLGCGLDDPGQHHRPERLIGQHLQPKLGVRVRQHLPQQLRGRRDHAAASVHRDRAPASRCRGHGVLQHGLPGPAARGPVRDIVDPRRHTRQLSQVQRVLTRKEPLTSCRQQQRQLRVGVGRPQMLHPLDLLSAARHDLHRDRPRRRADLANEPRDHPRMLPRRGY